MVLLHFIFTVRLQIQIIFSESKLRLIAQLVSLIETNLQITLDQESIHYLRLIRHLQYAIERVKKGRK